MDVAKLIEYHQRSGSKATLTAVQPAGRFGALHLDGDQVKLFEEKPQGDRAWVNGGFFVLSPAVFDYLEGDQTVWERGPMERLSREGQLTAYRHRGFWQAMDTVRDRTLLEDLWNSGRAPWKIW